MAYTSQEMMDGAKCIDCGIPQGSKLSVLIWLFGTIAGVTDPQTLMDNARCIDCGVPPGAQLSILNYLADLILAGGGVGGGSGVTCSASSDPSGVPTGNCGLWARLDNSKLWVYNSGSGNWDPYIA